MIDQKARQWLKTLVLRNYGLHSDFTACNIGRRPYKIELEKTDTDSIFRNIIFLINGLHEYNDKNADDYGRLPYEHSVQSDLGIQKSNIVHDLLINLLKRQGIILPDQPSKMIISHDIDTLHSGFIYELYRGVRTLDLPLIFRVLSALAVKKSLWWNLDEILELLDRYDFKSIFYFIVEKGRSPDGIKNADYNIENARIQAFINEAVSRGHEVGLHKSSLAHSTLDQEKAKLGKYCTSNRYHYLKYRIPDLYRNLSQSQFLTDCSLAFPYSMGFRNSYGLPFQPLDLKTGETLDILEIPFQIMDGMYPYRNQSDADYASKNIIEFIEKNNKNAVLGMLWHNTDLSEAGKKYSLETFKEVLKYLHESNIKSTTPRKIYYRYQ